MHRISWDHYNASLGKRAVLPKDFEQDVLEYYKEGLKGLKNLKVTVSERGEKLDLFFECESVEYDPGKIINFHGVGVEKLYVNGFDVEWNRDELVKEIEKRKK